MDPKVQVIRQSQEIMLDPLYDQPDHISVLVRDAPGISAKLPTSAGCSMKNLFTISAALFLIERAAAENKTPKDKFKIQKLKSQAFYTPGPAPQAAAGQLQAAQPPARPLPPAHSPPASVPALMPASHPAVTHPPSMLLPGQLPPP
ncbi:hypothetical protein DSO57_1000098 [Entomophthora muscae]|uniref:Uncharacterized protein n=1 Tax=Entomophthora muscae TaxID=34485 RepID=A0ACC2SM89_9FUNG|nr:hypothetical protein DSO57_1000098 [Entomophthora muscae]